MKHIKLLAIVFITFFSTSIVAKKTDRPQKKFFKQDLEKHLELQVKRGMKKGPSIETTSRVGFLPKGKNVPKKKPRKKR